MKIKCFIYYFSSSIDEAMGKNKELPQGKGLIGEEGEIENF